MTKVYNKLEGIYLGINTVTLPRIDVTLSFNLARTPTQRDKHLMKIEENGWDVCNVRVGKSEA
jgi:hypothetical protein